MRRTRNVLLACAAVLLLLLACVAFGPGLLDWNRYRGSIAAFASQQLGRPVRIGGRVSLTLLPQPVLTAEDIAVDDDGDGVDLRAKALRLRVALGPLLGGNVDARELVLQGADLRLPWPPAPTIFVQRPPAWLTGLDARVEDGRLQVGKLSVSGLQARIGTDPDTGTLSAAGTGQSGERTWAFTARLGRPGRDRSAALDLSLDGQGPLRDTGGTFSGTIGADGALSGRVAGRGPDLSLLMPAPALAWRGDGRLSAAGGLAIADELSLEIGGAPARGAVALRVTPAARLDVSITAGRLDLDAWLPALLTSGRPSLRAGVPTGIDLSAEAATLAGGTVRQLRGAIDLGGGPARLRDVVAILPGDTSLALSGTVDRTDTPHFEGDVRLLAPDLRTTLRWLQRLLPAAAVPAPVLRTADLSAHITADAGGAAVTELHGTLDGSAISGSAAIRAGARPNLSANLSFGRIDLAPWGTAAEPASALRTLLAMDADVRCQASAAQWNEVPLGAATLELQTDASRAAVRRLELQPFGARLSASGLVGDGFRLTDGRLDASAADLSALRPLLAILPDAAPGLEPLLRGAGSLSVQAAGPPEALAGRVQAELGDVNLDLRPTVNLPERRAAGSVTLHHPGAPRLLQLLGLGGTAPWLGDGSFSLVGQASVAPGRLELTGATLAAGSLRVSGRGVLEGRRITGQLSAETLPLPLPYPRSPEPLPFAALRTWQAALQVDAAEVLAGLTPVLRAASAEIALENGVLRIPNLSAEAEGGGRVTAAVTLDAAAEPPRLAASGTLETLPLAGPMFGTPLDVLAGQVSGSAELAAEGYSPVALLATSSGHVSIRVRDGVAVGFDLAAASALVGIPGADDATAAARGALMSGNTPFGTLDVPLTLSRGIVTTNATLAAPDGEARLSGTADLSGATLDLRLTLRPGPDAPELGERITGPFDRSVRIPELAGLVRWLAARPTQ